VKRLLIFAKYPKAGEVKTRLVPPLTYQQAEELYRAFLMDDLEKYQEIGEGIEIVIYMAGTPVEHEESSGIVQHRLADPSPDLFLMKGGEIRDQRGGGLGERMENAFREAFDDGCTMVCIVGTDLPTLPVEYVRQAFTALTDHDVAVGPTEDGGYYLLCMKRLHPSLFRELEFSTSDVFADTMSLASRDGLGVAVLPMWYDVDDRESLLRLWKNREMLATDSRTWQVMTGIDWFNTIE
jgi:rSAM/selenodomain-associated transferase 1